MGQPPLKCINPTSSSPAEDGFSSIGVRTIVGIVLSVALSIGSNICPVPFDILTFRFLRLTLESDFWRSKYRQTETPGSRVYPSRLAIRFLCRILLLRTPTEWAFGQV